MHNKTNISKLAILVLNWNGWQDTVECVTSLMDSEYENFTIIIIDNGSNDDSVVEIKNKINQGFPDKYGPELTLLKNSRKKVDYFEIAEKEAQSFHIDKSDKDKFPQIIILKNRENYGFAAGNNVGIQFALKNGFKNIMLLNNDTTILPESLEKLVQFLDEHQSIDVITPKICYYDNPEYIWNCGGKLTFTGSRKYYCKDELSKEYRNGYQKITFVTGCALLVRSKIFSKFGLLTERFFLGEEDYEFSLRMRKNGIQMASVFESTIFHKVGRTKDKVFTTSDLPNAFIHHLNRTIDMRQYYNRFYWKIWRIVFYIIIFFKLIILKKVQFPYTFKYILLIHRYSSKYKTVSKRIYFNIKRVLK